MKLLKITTAILAFSFASTISQADTRVYQDWSNSAVITYKDYNGNRKAIHGIINHSFDGKQRFYILDHYRYGRNVCEYESAIPEETTMIFNGQAVKMQRWCKRFVDTNQYLHQFTPSTPKGHTYVVNLFKKSVTPVKIEYNGKVFYMPTNGFTKEWNRLGGNAI